MDSAAPLSLNTYWKLKPLGVQLQIPESTTFDVHLTTHIDCDGIVTIRSRRDDLLPLCLPFIEDTQQLAKAIYNIIAEMECIMHDASPMSKNLIGKYFTEDEKLKGIVDYLNNNPRRVFRSKGVYIRMVDQYHGDPSGNLMSSNTPLSPASEKNLPSNLKEKSFADLVIKPACAAAVISKLHELIDGTISPIDIVMPLRAAMDAGV
jgi:hypothetical protein